MMQKLLRFRYITAVLAIALGAALLSSCEKEEDVIPSPSYSIATNFVGEYVGISDCDTGVVHFIINAGPDQTQVSIPAFFGDGDCRNNTNVIGYVKADSMSIPTTSFTDLCFQDYTVKLDAKRVVDSLFFSVSFTSPQGDSTCHFAGRKL